MENNKTGLLLNEKNIKLHRTYFNQMVKLLGIQVEYRAPRSDKHYDNYGELETSYYEPITIGCIFNDHKDQRTMRKLGWNAELDDSTSLITVSYDTPNIQVGALFSIPSGIDNAPNRLFRVIKMSVGAIYPATITCEIAPIYNNIFDKRSIDYKNNDMNHLIDSTNDRNGKDFIHLKDVE